MTSATADAMSASRPLRVPVPDASLWLILAVTAFRLVAGSSILDAYNADTLIYIGPASLSTIGTLQMGLLGMLAARVGMLLLAGHRLRRPDLPVVGLLLFAGCSLAWSSSASRVEGPREWLYLAFPVGTYLVASLGLGEASQRRALGLRLLGFLVVIAASSLVHRDAVSAESTGAHIWDLRAERARGIAGSPNILAGTLAMLMAIALGALLARQRPGVKRKAMLGLLLGGMGLALTYSRSGFVGFALGTAVALAARRRFALLSMAALAGSVAFVASGAGYRMFGQWEDFVRDPTDTSNVAWLNAVVRIDMWRRAADDLLTPGSAVVGRGLGAVAGWCVADDTCRDAGGLHSELVQTGLDLGLVGLGLLGAMYATFARRAWRCVRGGDAWQRTWGVATLAIIAIALPRLVWDFVFTGSTGVLLMVAGAMVSRVPPRSPQDRGDRT